MFTKSVKCFPAGTYVNNFVIFVYFLKLQVCKRILAHFNGTARKFRKAISHTSCTIYIGRVWNPDEKFSTYTQPNIEK